MASKLTGEEKAAILLRAIGEDAAAEVMRHLAPKDVRRIGAQLAGLSSISREQESDVMQEFRSAAGSGVVGFEGKEYVKNVLNKALGQDKAKNMLEMLVADSYPGIESLKWTDARMVSQLIKAEHPQTIAVILAHLEADQAAKVLTGLPEAMRNDVVIRLATSNEVQPETLQFLSETLQHSLQAKARPRSTSIGGARVVAEIMTRLDKTSESSILGALTERDQALAESIRSLMFVFDDLVKIDDRGIQEILKEASKDDLALALRAGSPEVQEKIYRNMSSRAAATLKEDMEARGPVKLSDVEQAQQNILKICRKLEGEGKIMIAGAGEAMV